MELSGSPKVQAGPWSRLMGCLWEKDLTASLYCILRRDHTVADGPGVSIDLEVIPTLHTRKGRKMHTYVYLEEVPGLRPSTRPAMGSPPHTGPCRAASPPAPRPTTQNSTFSAFTRSALTCCVTWDKCAESSRPQPSDLCNGAEEHRLFSGSLLGDGSVTLCPGPDLGVIRGGKHLG